MTAFVRSYIQGPRWAGIAPFLRRAAQATNCDIEINTEKGFIRETVFFKASGEEDDVERFIACVKESLKVMEE